jgi:hypothetical protein
MFFGELDAIKNKHHVVNDTNLWSQIKFIAGVVMIIVVES